MARIRATVEPLPLVPATWTTGGSLSCGFPSAAHKARIRSSDKSMRWGCRARRRSEIGSIRTGLRRLLLLGGSAHQHGQDQAQGGRQVAARHHLVDHALVLEVFGALEARRQFLAD